MLNCLYYFKASRPLLSLTAELNRTVFYPRFFFTIIISNPLSWQPSFLSFCHFLQYLQHLHKSYSKSRVLSWRYLRPILVAMATESTCCLSWRHVSYIFPKGEFIRSTKSFFFDMKFVLRWDSIHFWEKQLVSFTLFLLFALFWSPLANSFVE